MSRCAIHADGRAHSHRQERAKVIVDNTVGVWQESMQRKKHCGTSLNFSRISSVTVGPPRTASYCWRARLPVRQGLRSQLRMFVGLGAARVRDLLLQARNIAPAIIFMDEFARK